jgi:hypothetical protein
VHARQPFCHGATPSAPTLGLKEIKKGSVIGQDLRKNHGVEDLWVFKPFHRMRPHNPPLTPSRFSLSNKKGKLILLILSGGPPKAFTYFPSPSPLPHLPTGLPLPFMLFLPSCVVNPIILSPQEYYSGHCPCSFLHHQFSFLLGHSHKYTICSNTSHLKKKKKKTL